MVSSQNHSIVFHGTHVLTFFHPNSFMLIITPQKRALGRTNFIRKENIQKGNYLPESTHFSLIATLCRRCYYSYFRDTETEVQRH